jgi:hypothetical protein
VSWELVFARHAQKDAQKLAASGLKANAQELLAIIKENPFQNLPPVRTRGGSIFSIAWFTRCCLSNRSSRFCACGRTMNRLGHHRI